MPLNCLFFPAHVINQIVKRKGIVVCLWFKSYKTTKLLLTLVICFAIFVILCRTHVAHRDIFVNWGFTYKIRNFATTCINEYITTLAIKYLYKQYGMHISLLIFLYILFHLPQKFFKTFLNNCVEILIEFFVLVNYDKFQKILSTRWWSRKSFLTNISMF